ncbi:MULTISPECIES: type II secretion system protein J [unclassified Halanaerobium]|uniref:PulJ/GspJ family protein n=1 Tax=unclassified Halanaerobium TaxID=2641197 RepID=UPI000DF3D8E1|nr:MULTISPECIES: prepilin-type N-terminal cleavage/methylation domain-containing protein [unclassified Halanaerobium]RCW50526.1 prepilin-type N-terminal cleavage/methylation domain-containing protein [Halanaerobium sp. MA284_MarDTE_T2]RCW86009.1 prepilin-type N-terminal cleavage/methylation domain-containing protein [Halanaerobium sp. DL-01]
MENNNGLKFGNNKGFTLLEILLALTITAVLTISFLQIISLIYRDHNLLNKRLGHQMDGHLAVDYIFTKIKMAEIVDIPDKNTLEVYTYIDGEKRWLKFYIYQSEGIKKLGQSQGSASIENRDYSRVTSIIDNIEEVKFKKLSNKELVLIEIEYRDKNRKYTYKKIASVF